MSQVLRAANFTRELEVNDFRVLLGIELGMRRYEIVPPEQISFYARLDKGETNYRLDTLHKKGLLQRISDVGYVGYQLISESYDILALHTLESQNILSAIGEPLARGKESDVFYAKDLNEQTVALKIHRVGQTSFRRVRPLRSYVQNRKHISWLYINRLSAERENEALLKLEPLNIKTPKSLGYNRHMIVMNLIKGQDLDTHPIIENPQNVLDQILEQIERVFVQAKMIHCDLSEYNILITPDDQIIFIDWPQWEPSTHPNARLYLTRDVQNVQNFFQKIYNITFDSNEFVNSLLEK